MKNSVQISKRMTSPWSSHRPRPLGHLGVLARVGALSAAVGGCGDEGPPGFVESPSGPPEDEAIDQQALVAAAAFPVQYIGAPEVNQIRERIRRGEEPWTSARARVVDEANRALGQGPWSVADNGGYQGNRHAFFTEPPYCGWKKFDGQEPDCRDGQINPGANRQDYSDAIAVSRAVVCWHFS